jgi:hypothetical protein
VKEKRLNETDIGDREEAYIEVKLGWTQAAKIAMDMKCWKIRGSPFLSGFRLLD